MEKEYGGYLPLELSKGRPYYIGEDVIALNAGRYAITYAIEEAAGRKSIFLTGSVTRLKMPFMSVFPM